MGINVAERPMFLTAASHVVSANNQIRASLDGINNAVQANINEKQTKIPQQIVALKQREQELLKILGCNSIDELNERIKEFNNLSNFAFTGAELARKIITPYTNKQEALAAQNQEAFEFLVKQKIPEFFNSEESKDLSEELLKKKYLELINSISKTLGKKQGSKQRGVFTSTKLIDFSVDGQSMSLNRATKQQKQLWARAIKEMQRKKNKLAEEFGSLPEEIIQKNTRASIYLDEKGGVINYSYVTDNKKGSEIGSKLTKAQERKLKELKTAILGLVGNDRAAKHVSRAWDKVVEKDPTAFFVGGSGKSLTGLFGEIQAMAYISFLLEGSAFENQADWVAKQYGNETNPHADIILKNLNLSGIQVKNSIKDINPFDNIHFATLNFSNFFSRLQSFGGGAPFANNEYKNLISQAFIDELFNQTVFRDKNTGQWEYGDNPAFNDIRSDVVSLANKATELLSSFTAALMYLSADSAIEKLNPGTTMNVLFILGSRAVLASQALTERNNSAIQLDSSGRVITSNRFSVEPLLEDRTYDIKYYYNEINRSESFAWSELKDQPANLDLLEKIKLQTAYNFTGL